MESVLQVHALSIAHKMFDFLYVVAFSWFESRVVMKNEKSIVSCDIFSVDVGLNCARF